jgi:hypothetical protein
MRSPVLLALLLLAVPSHAGVVYDFVTTVEAPRTTARVAGRIWIEGSAYRAELAPDPARKIDVVISKDADRTAMFLDTDGKTWVDRVRVSHDLRSSSMFLWPVAGAAVRGRPRIEHRVEGTSEVAGQRATQHVVTTHFTVESKLDGSPVRGTIQTVSKIWIADTLPSLPMDRQLRTGYPEVDRKLAPIFEKLEGMIVRHELKVIRAMEGGPPQIETTRTEVSGIAVVDVPPETFEVPQGFAYAGTRAP